MPAQNTSTLLPREVALRLVKKKLEEQGFPVAVELQIITEIVNAIYDGHMVINTIDGPDAPGYLAWKWKRQEWVAISLDRPIEELKSQIREQKAKRNGSDLGAAVASYARGESHGTATEGTQGECASGSSADPQGAGAGNS